MQQTNESQQLKQMAANRDYCGIIKLLKSQRIKKLEETALLAGFWMISPKANGKERVINYIVEQVANPEHAKP